MNNRFTPALVSGFAAAVLMTVPAFKSLTCCFILPMAAWLTLYLDQRINGISHISGSKGAAMGLVTGIAAAVIASILEVLLTLLFKANDFSISLPQMINELPKIFGNFPIEDIVKQLRMIAREITTTGFSPMYTMITFISNAFSGIIFGMVGGLVGATFINRRNSEKRDE